MLLIGALFIVLLRKAIFASVEAINVVRWVITPADRAMRRLVFIAASLGVVIAARLIASGLPRSPCIAIGGLFALGAVIALAGALGIEGALVECESDAYVRINRGGRLLAISLGLAIVFGACAIVWYAKSRV